MVAVYFGSRACNREVASRDVRKQAQEALAREIGPQNAETALNRYHRSCFDETFRTGWGRRQASKFDDEKYVVCLTDSVRKDRGLRQGASSAPEPVRIDKGEPPPRPTRDNSGPLRVHDGRVYFYQPPGTVAGIALKVSGEPLPRFTEVACRLVCDGAPVGPEFGQCGRLELGFQGDPSAAVVTVPWERTPRCRSFAVELGLVVETLRPPRRWLPVSNTLVVPVPDRPVRPLG